MPTRTDHSFGESLADLGVSMTRVSSSDFGAHVSEIVEPPAVGVELDEVGVSLDGTPVTVDPTPAAVREATTGVTTARLAVGDYGTTVLWVTDDGSEFVSLFVDRHVVVCREGAVQADMESTFDALGPALRDERGSVVLATGPSATADMGALVKGAHGPSDVHVVLVTEEENEEE